MRKIVLLLALLAGCAASPYREPPGDAQMAAVRNGMSVAEVEQLLGPPDGGTSVFGEETVTGWRTPVRGHGVRAAYFNVHFRGGKVVRTSRSVEYLGG